MAKTSPRVCTTNPASTKADLGPGEFNRKSAAVTITHPAASRRNPAILMYRNAFQFEYRITLLCRSSLVQSKFLITPRNWKAHWSGDFLLPCWHLICEIF
jgi:hypothetical protein